MGDSKHLKTNITKMLNEFKEIGFIKSFSWKMYSLQIEK
jgi:hypothetical protein